MIKREIKLIWNVGVKGKGIYIDLAVWDTDKQDSNTDAEINYIEYKNIDFTDESNEYALSIAHDLSEKYNAIVDNVIRNTFVEKTIKMTRDSDTQGAGIYIDLQVVNPSDDKELIEGSVMNIGFADNDTEAICLAEELAEKHNAVLDKTIY